jgi:hypothetical protein
MREIELILEAYLLRNALWGAADAASHRAAAKRSGVRVGLR